MITLYRLDGSIIGEFQVDSVKEAVEFADKQGISLAYANLAFADLEDVSLAFANLIEASLEGANLIKASLESANLTNANLTRADLLQADLSSVCLKGANLEGANFTGAYFDFAAISLQCKSTGVIIDDRFAAQLAHLLTRQDYSNCSEEVKKEIEQIKSMSLANLLAKYRNDIKLI